MKTLVELFIVRKTKNSDERTCFFLLFYLSFSLLQLGEKPISLAAVLRTKNSLKV